MIEYATAFILSLIINSLYIVGLQESTEEDMILSRPRRWLDKVLPINIHAPVIGCVQCMASVHGVIFTTIIWVITGWHPLWGLILYIPALSKMNCFISLITTSLINKVNGE